VIIGIGVDLEEVSRIRDAISRHGQRFLDRVFTEGEIAYVQDKANPYERYAARFAAKEAVMKALGCGWAQGVRWRDIEVINEENGRPTLRLSGVAEEIARQKNCRTPHVSLSHTKNNAIAQVVLEG